MELSGTDWLRPYLALPNYVSNLLRLGFSPGDDAIIAWGDEEAVLRRVSEHQSAGAEDVSIQALEADPKTLPRDQWGIAAALNGMRS